MTHRSHRRRSNSRWNSAAWGGLKLARFSDADQDWDKATKLYPPHEGANLAAKRNRCLIQRTVKQDTKAKADKNSEVRRGLSESAKKDGKAMPGKSEENQTDQNKEAKSTTPDAAMKP